MCEQSRLFEPENRVKVLLTSISAVVSPTACETKVKCEQLASLKSREALEALEAREARAVRYAQEVPKTW